MRKGRILNLKKLRFMIAIQNTSYYPVKQRHVNPATVVRARGSFVESAPCPDNLLNKIDSAVRLCYFRIFQKIMAFQPCNTHVCAKKLSEFDWKKDSTNNVATYFYDVNAESKSCYKMRDVPLGDYLVEIDTLDLIETIACGSLVANRLMSSQ